MHAIADITVLNCTGERAGHGALVGAGRHRDWSSERDYSVFLTASPTSARSEKLSESPACGR